jgi:hypothetical protein
VAAKRPTPHRRTKGGKQKTRTVRATPKERALAAVREMRAGRSLTAAATRSGTTPRTIRRYAGKALSKQGVRVAVAAYDRVPRTLRFLTDQGAIALTVSDSRQASQVSAYWHAIEVYLREGDRRLLKPFERIVLRLRGQRYRFVTNPRLLDRLAHAGQFEFEELYATTA